MIPSPAEAPVGVIRRDGRTDPFFAGAAEERLMIRRCSRCGQWHAPDVTGCAGCGTSPLDWAPGSGDAVLVSWTVVHLPGEKTAPLALVELDEGPWLHTRLVGVAEPREELRLRAVFVHPGEGESYPVFTERE